MPYVWQAEEVKVKMKISGNSRLEGNPYLNLLGKTRLP